MKIRLHRRAVLRGAGNVALALPFLEAMAVGRRAHAQAAPPKRLVVLFTPIGHQTSKFWPTAGAGGLTFPAGSNLAPLEPHKGDLLFLKGLDMKTAAVSSGAGHPRGMGNLLTAVRLLPGQFNTGSGGTVGWGRGISFDQRIANVVGGSTRFRSVEFGVQCRPPTTNSVLSYRGDALPLPPENNPATLFQRLFAGMTGITPTPTSETDWVLAQRRSVLDAVLGEYQRMAARLGAADRQRLEEHLEALREVERQVDAVTQPPSGGGAGCAVPAAPSVPMYLDNANYEAAGDAQMKLLVAALRCDLTRVATLQYSNGTSERAFPWLGVLEEHHSISHKGDSDAVNQAKLSKIYTWYAAQAAKLLQLLKTTSEADGSPMLSNTLVFWVTEVMQGNNHLYSTMPWVLAGGTNLGIQTGRLLTFNGVPHNNLLLSLVNRLGVPDTNFGEAEYCTGPLSGV